MVVYRLRIVLPLVLLLLALPAQAATWWDGKWAYRAKIDLNTTSTGAALQQAAGRTPVLVRLHSGNFNFADAKEDGSDVRFIAGDDRTPLKYHFEKYDGLVDQVALAWVDVPTLEANANVPIYVYFGNPEASAGADAKGTYDADTIAVYHFANQASAGQDATAYSNQAGTPLTLADAGLIGAGLRLGGGEAVTVPASASLNLAPAQPLTLTAWVKPASADATAVLASLPAVLTVLLENGAIVVETVSAGAVVRTTPGNPIKPDGWTHVAVRADGKTLAVYVNGQPVGEVPAVLPAASSGLSIGGEQPESGSPRPNFIGQIDEFVLSKTARPVGAIEAAARSQGTDARLIAFEPVEQRSGDGGHGYFGILFNALTPDAWIVIVILSIMALISWWVMIGKGLYINATAKANERFLAAFRKRAGEHPLHDEIWVRDAENGGPLNGERSNLARLLDVGLDELRSRLAAGGGRSVVRPQSIAAIRSALDAAAVREGQRLNRLMVLLTIAISGGPFLGLLGTVVGVMITFAAVAAAGDVNINAIAPGIAAALLATVAGLAVAIPALFGYNYLLSRTEAISADMQVFVDELEKRIAEDYAGDAITPHLTRTPVGV
jgi:biopolymer transport protein ExbB